MGDTSFTEVTSRPWAARVGRSFLGIAVGGAMFVGALVLLFWNEGRAVRTARSLAEGAAAVIPIDAATVDPANEGKLVHLTAEAAATGERLTDNLFGVSATALRLRRKVEMYQWKETRRTRNRQSGSRSETVTTYDYSTVWSEEVIKSDDFHRPSHENPKLKPLPSRDFTANPVALGAFTLSPAWVEQIENWQSVRVNKEQLAAVREDLRGRLQVEDGYFYLPARVAGPTTAAADTQPVDPEQEEDWGVGDVRVSFAVAPATTVSVLARQVGTGFEPYQTKAGDRIGKLMVGSRTAAEMFAEERRESTALTWLGRVGGFLGLWVGLMFVLGPLRVLADVVPVLGGLTGVVVAVVSALVAAVVTLLTVAIGWLFYRPALAALLIGVALAVAWGLRSAARRRMLRHAPRGGAGAHSPSSTLHVG